MRAGRGGRSRLDLVGRAPQQSRVVSGAAHRTCRRREPDESEKRGRESFLFLDRRGWDTIDAMAKCRVALATGGIAYHVLNRRVSWLPLFEKPADYTSFEKILTDAYERTNISIVPYCFMSDRWHLLL